MENTCHELFPNIPDKKLCTFVSNRGNLLNAETVNSFTTPLPKCWTSFTHIRSYAIRSAETPGTQKLKTLREKNGGDKNYSREVTYWVVTEPESHSTWEQSKMTFRKFA
ncbi:hypothetical protein BaRGS_00033308 [Batillaria attramentaria]|uniref:Chromo domain-containing protein n=1 Tax=Batillaria attramentaria TaxID=370345 RepID=A0ABD0JLT9_9CAEN